MSEEQYQLWMRNRGKKAILPPTLHQISLQASELEHRLALAKAKLALKENVASQRGPTSESGDTPGADPALITVVNQMLDLLKTLQQQLEAEGAQVDQDEASAARAAIVEKKYAKALNHLSAQIQLSSAALCPEGARVVANAALFKNIRGASASPTGDLAGVLNQVLGDVDAKRAAANDAWFKKLREQAMPQGTGPAPRTREQARAEIFRNLRK